MKGCAQTAKINLRNFHAELCLSPCEFLSVDPRKCIRVEETILAGRWIKCGMSLYEGWRACLIRLVSGW